MNILNTVYAQGEGIPLILLHAFPVDHRMWDECARLITAKAEESGLAPVSVYAPDMPGAGECPVPDESSTGARADDGAYTEALDNMAHAFVDLLHQLGHRQAIWVGLSMGGYLALAIQRLHPEAVAGMALCDTKADADSPESRRHRLQIAEECEASDGVEAVMGFAQPHEQDSDIKKSQRIVDLFTQWIRSQSPQGVAWRERMAAGRCDQNDQLATITTPALVLSGDLDPSSPPASMRPMADAMTKADVRFVEVGNSGHFSAVEHPESVANALVNLVERVRTAQ